MKAVFVFRSKRLAAFTLIELLVVIAIIAMFLTTQEMEKIAGAPPDMNWK